MLGKEGLSGRAKNKKEGRKRGTRGQGKKAPQQRDSSTALRSRILQETPRKRRFNRGKRKQRGMLHRQVERRTIPVALAKEERMKEEGGCSHVLES